MKLTTGYCRQLFITALGVLFVLLVSTCRFPNKDGSVVVHRDKHRIELKNAHVRLLLLLDSSVIRQQYYANDNNGWKLVAESLQRTLTSDAVMPLYKTGAGVAGNYRLLVNDGFRTANVIDNKDGKAKIELTGEIQGRRVEQTIYLGEGDDHFHSEVKAELGNDPKIEYLLSSYNFSIDGKPDFTFVPTIKRSNDDVVGDRKFFAPAAIVEKDGFMFSLVPDLDMINSDVVYAKGARPQMHPRIFAVPFDTTKTSLPVALDLDVHSGVSKNTVIAYGPMDYWTEQHVYWRHENENGEQVRQLSKNVLRYGFDLFINSGINKYRGYQRLSSFLWNKYGHRYFNMPKPQAMPFSEYAKVCYPASFAYEGYEVNMQKIRKSEPGTPELTWNQGNHRNGHPELTTWQQWEQNGVPMGAMLLSAPQWDKLLYNTAWWNNVCDATGFYFWGNRLNDSGLIDKARRVINFTLSAPQKDGMFPSLYNIKEHRWIGSLWNPPLDNYKPDSTANYWDWENGAYQTSSASVTAGFLLMYRRTCEDRPGIVDYVKRYGDFLLRNMQQKGCVAAWFNKDLTPLPSMKWNADGGAHMWVLSELYRATNDKKYLDAAQKMAGFMMNEVMPQQKWYDFETFYSCAVKPETFFDARTGQYPANTMAVLWALEGFASLFDVTKNDLYLKAGEAVADYSIFYQAVWAPHYIITAYPFGGFSSQNSDAEWLDQRSHRFADGLVRIGLLSGRQDLLERAVAATRSSLTLVNHPRHIENDIYKFPNFPLGLGPENIDHEGFPQMPLRSGPSWCEVGGLAAAAHVINQLGGIYVDAKKNIALGIDAVSVTQELLKDNTIRLEIKSLLAGLHVPYEQAFRIDLYVAGLENKEYKLVLNGGPAINLKPADVAKVALLIYPDNKIVVENRKI